MSKSTEKKPDSVSSILPGLAGHWVLVAVETLQQKPEMIPAGVQASMQIEAATTDTASGASTEPVEQANIVGHFGCNRFFGTLKLHRTGLDAGLDIGPLAMSRRACGPPLDPFEHKTVGSLDSATSYQLSDEGRALSLSGTEYKLQFKKVVREIVYIAPAKASCTGVAPQQCLLLKRDPDEEFQYFYDQITGFDFTAGYNYKLLVEITPQSSVPADASSVTYQMIELLEKTQN